MTALLVHFITLIKCVVIAQATVSSYQTVFGGITLRTGRNAASSPFTVMSEIQCVFRCEKFSNGCSMALFRPSTGECALYVWENVGMVALPMQADEVLETKVMMRMNYQHVLVTVHKESHYAIPFADASNFCARVGGRVASESDLNYAHGRNWGVCRCGWLTNAHAYFWVLTVSSGCGTTNRWKCSDPKDMYDVHCRIE